MGEHMKSILLLATLVFSVPLSAKIITTPIHIFSADLTGKTLSCTIIVVTGAETFEKKFSTSPYSQGHSVPEFVAEGKRSKITAMADGKWLGLSWFLDDELIAESISLIRDTIKQPRVLILYNPQNQDEQVSLDCSV